MFLTSEYEVVNDELSKSYKIIQSQKKELIKNIEEVKGDRWIIQEKDTEIRIINKEKDNIQDKLLDQRLEYRRLEKEFEEFKNNLPVFNPNDFMSDEPNNINMTLP